MIFLHLKRYFSDPYRALLYCLAILLIAALQLGFIAVTTQSNAFIISVYDDDNTSKSQAFIKAINQHELIQITNASSEDKTQILDGSVDALLIIPKNYFTSQDKKIDLFYLKSNVKVPAIIDILAVPLLPDTLAYKLNIAAKGYGYPSNLTERYQNIYTHLAESIDVDVNIWNERKYAIGEYALAKKEDKMQTIALSYFLLSILLIFPTASLDAKKNTLHKRLSVISSQNLPIFSSIIIADALYYIPPISIIAIAAYHQFDMPIPTLFWLCASGILITTILHQVFKLIFMHFDATFSTLTIMPLVIFSALISGVFFDSGLLSVTLKTLGKFLPFGLSSAMYDSLYSVGSITFPLILAILTYLCLGILLIILLYRCLFSTKITNNNNRR